MALTVAQLVARLTADTSGFYRGMALANSSMIRTGGIIGRVAAGAGLAVAGMGILSLRTAGNFQESMNILQAVSGATEKQFEALHDEAIALGRDMKLPNVSAKDAAEAMQELAKAGLSVKDVMGATRGTLQFGIAANIGFADSANIVARALTAFHLEGNQAVRVADLFTAAANKSTASAQDIALGFQMASAQFAAGDQTIQGLTTSLTLMANAGIVGSDAGTSLKTMMNRLMSPTKKAKDLMADLGFKVYDSSGNMKAMPDIIGNLSDSLKGMSKEQQNAALYTIFGSDAIRAARVQLAAGEAGWRRMEERITKGGEAQAFAEARTKGFNGAVQALFSAVETLAIELGEAMLPAAERVTRAMANFVNSIDPAKIIGFFSAIKDGIVWMVQLVQNSELLQFALAGLVGGLLALKAVTSVIALFKALQIAWMALNASFVASPLGILVLAIGALVAALALAYMKSEEFRAAVDGAFSWIRDNVLPIFQQVADGIKEHWDDIMQIVRIATFNIRMWYEQFVMRIVNFTRQHWDQISAIIMAVFNQILIMVRGVMKSIEGVINLVMGIIKGDWGRAWEGIKQIVDGTFGTIAALIKNSLTRLIPAVLSLALSIGKAILTGIGNGIANLAGWLLGKIQSGISSAISSVAGWVVGAATAIGRAIMDGILSGVGGLAGALADKVKGAVQGALSSVGGFLGIGSPSKKTRDEIGKPMGEGIIAGFLLGTAELPSKISESLRNALEAGKKVVEEYQQRFKDAFAQMASDALAAFDALTEAHRTKSEKLLEQLVSEHDKEEFRRRVQEARQAVEEARAAIESFDPTQFGSEEEAREAYVKLQQDLASAQDEWNELMYQKRKMALERQAEKERENYEARRAIQRRHLENELDKLLEYLIKHPKEHKKTQDKIIALLHSYGISYRDAGSVVGEAYAQGLRDSMSAVVAAATEMANRVSRILRTHSPTKEGPMSDLDTWWRGFGETLASGLDARPVERAAAAMAGLVRPSVGGALAMGGSGGALAGGGTVVNQYYIEGSLIAEQAMNDRIREAIITESRRGRTITAA